MTDIERRGYLLGIIAVVLFSLTFPFTKMALKGLDATFVGLGRSVAVAIPSAALLLITRQSWPKWQHLGPLILVAGGAVIGFPVLLAYALTEVHSSHAAVVSGIIPLFTAVLGSWRDQQRQPPLFWIAALTGSGVVLAFAWLSGDGTLSMADLALFGAAASAAIGYTEGAKLGREIGSWQVICWALLLAAPFLLYPTLVHYPRNATTVSFSAWIGFAYTAFISMFVGYFIWYRGLALGGIARVSQIQMVQPFLALAFSALLLGEHLTPLAIVCALLVFSCVIITRRIKPQTTLVLEEV